MSEPSITTRIWHEEAEADNPFAARVARCRGFDVYGDMLGRARWVEMLALLFRDQPLRETEADLLETLAVALANPGPRDPAVHAAMCGGVGGSTSAACLIAALAVGAGQYAGAREVLLTMQAWQTCATDLNAWRQWLAAPSAQEVSIWPSPQHPPGFDPHGASAATPLKQVLACLSGPNVGPRLVWLERNREELEKMVGLPLALSAVAAAAFADLDFTPEQGEMLYLLLRLPGSAAHALEQRQLGHKKFPFFELELQRDTGEER